MPIGHLHVLFGEMSIQVFCTFFEWIFSFYAISINILRFRGFPCGSAGKESACNAGDLGSTPGLGKYSGEREGYPLQYSGLENSRDYIVHGVAKSWTALSDFHFQGNMYNEGVLLQSFQGCIR